MTSQAESLANVIADNTGAGDKTDLETAFVRLYSDLKQGSLATTLMRAGVAEGSPEAARLITALATADEQVTLSAEIIRQTPNISAHKQQRLFNELEDVIRNGREAAKSLIPRHPRESEAFQSYSDILELCHGVILGLDTSKNLHRFHALIARRWMQGTPLPQIIDDQIKRHPNDDIQSTIRKTLDLIEKDIRFQAVRLIGCYSTLLVHALNKADMAELVPSIPSLALYLEVGASDKTMISFIALGLSRVTAMKLNDLSARKDLDTAAALQWLRTRSLDSLGLSPLLLAEVRSIIAA